MLSRPRSRWKCASNGQAKTPMTWAPASRNAAKSQKRQRCRETPAPMTKTEPRSVRSLRHRAPREPLRGTESLQTRRWRGLDSNFQCAGAVNLIVALLCRAAPTRMRQRSALTPSRMIVAACAALVSALSRKRPRQSVLSGRRSSPERLCTNPPCGLRCTLPRRSDRRTRRKT
jgi:hypothetical protein